MICSFKLAITRGDRKPERIYRKASSYNSGIALRITRSCANMLFNCSILKRIEEMENT